MNECREEAEMVMFTSVRRVLEQTGLKPKQVGDQMLKEIFNMSQPLAETRSLEFRNVIEGFES